MVSVLKTFLSLLNNFDNNFLHDLVEAVNDQLILLELIVNLVANAVKIRVDTIAEAASIVLQVNVLALLSLREWMSSHSVIGEDELPSLRRPTLSK